MTSVPYKTGLAPQVQSVPFDSNVIARKMGVNYSGFVVPTTPFLEKLTKPQVGEIRTILKKYGYSVPNTFSQVKNFITSDPIFSSFANQSRTFADFKLQLLNEQIPGDTTGAANLPSRTIAEQNPDTLKKLISDTYISAKGEKPDDMTVNKVLKQWQDSINQGTLVTTSKVKNAKTGKLENVTKSTSGFSQAGAVAGLEKQIQTENPEEVQRRKAFEFSDAFNKVMSGGM